MQPRDHWQQVYTSKAPDEVSWFQAHATPSLRLIRGYGVPPDAAIIDVGGGASTLVDDLLANHFENLSVLDISEAALAATKARLGDRASAVRWLEADILETALPEATYDVWHDRAVFHFLTTPEERQSYVRAVIRAVKPGGLVMVATFAEDGPTRCSGLPVCRYSASELHAALGEAFALLESRKETHHTPGGNEQKFLYCVFQLRETPHA